MCEENYFGDEKMILEQTFSFFGSAAVSRDESALRDGLPPPRHGR